MPRQEAAAIVGKQGSHLFIGVLRRAEQPLCLAGLKVQGVQERPLAASRGAVAGKKDSSLMRPQNVVAAWQSSQDRGPGIVVTVLDRAIPDQGGRRTRVFEI